MHYYLSELLPCQQQHKVKVRDVIMTENGPRAERMNGREEQVKTFFAPPERASDDELQAEIAFVSHNPILDGLLHSVSGLLAVLNEHRQILAVNDSLLEMLGIDDAKTALGLRPGEALKCIHACEMPGGCGTSEYCSTCGAAISIVSSLAKNQPVEKECTITAEKNGKKQDLFFRVRCVPLTFRDRRVLLLFLQDISYQQRLVTLERVFFHDIINILNMITMTSDLLVSRSDGRNKKTAEMLNALSKRLENEIAIQRYLSQAGPLTYRPVFTSMPVQQLMQEIRDIYSGNPVSQGKRLTIPDDVPAVTVTTDHSLLLRVLGNMINNAFEATEAGGEIRLWVEQPAGKIVFCVGNRSAIPRDIAKRVFQRNFSTKTSIGRGLGTYSMKLFGEDILHGSVDFTSSEADGTVFRFSLQA